MGRTGSDSGVERFQVVDHAVMVEAGEAFFSCGEAVAASFFGIGDQVDDGGHELIGPVGGNEVPGGACGDGFCGSVKIEGDDGDPHEGGLGGDAGEPFPP